MAVQKPIRNIGIFAHVDAGKTTLSEQLLAHAGAIRKKGSVDSGTAHTDLLPVERRRGISVKATCVKLEHKGVQVNLIDTPGHVDFMAEIERSLWALDAAVLVICAVEGVQPQTELLFQAMQKQHMPVLIFINKIDREGADVERVKEEIHRYLSPKACLVDDEELMTEIVCDEDEELMELYLEGEEIEAGVLRDKFREICRMGVAYPILCGAALRDLGMEPVLDGIVDFFPAAVCVDALCGVVFAAQQDKALGRGVWVRLFGGRLENRMSLDLAAGIDPMTGEEKVEQRKISQIQDVDGSAAGLVEGGEIAIVYGLGDIPIGYVLGDETLLPHSIETGNLRKALITTQVIPQKAEDMQALRQACMILSGEDPMLEAQYIRSLNELHLHVMGKIQMEIIEEILQNRFQLAVTFSPPAIIYKETIREACEGYVAYLMPKPCWAILRFRIEPGERGSGVVYKSLISSKTLKLRYQHQVEQAIPLALNQGRLGWQVTDVKITLIDGNDHQWHTHPLDFIVATPMAIQDGLRNGGSVLLEPILEARFLLPEDCVGRVMSDVINMRGEVTDNISEGERVILKALIPVQTSLDYAATLAANTGGRGAMSVRLHGYQECALEQGAVAQRRSVDPLDMSKYILAARSALEGGIFNME